MPKATTPTANRQARRHNPLEVDILATGLLRQRAPKRKSKDLDENDAEGYVESKPSKKILQLGRELVEEDQEASSKAEQPHDAFEFGSRFDQADDQDEDVFGDEEGQWADEDEDVEEADVDANDLETFHKFLPDDQSQDPLLKYGWDQAQAAGRTNDEASGTGLSLADMILAKIAEHETTTERGVPVPVPDEHEFPPRVIEVYTRIGELLQRYRSGKVPKPVKILPTVPGWEGLLEYLQPDLWTPNALYEVTKIFSSSKPAASQRWLELVILDSVRDNIRETKKLSVHLFNALKKSLYHPSAFFKGFLFPLVGSGNCTLREATIVSAVLTRTSVPVLHSAAAIKSLCEISSQQSLAGSEGGGAANVLIETLLKKRYALPYQVIDSLVFYFLRYRAVDPASMQEGLGMSGNSGAGAGNSDRPLPVIWHRCFLAFAERYKNDITEDQREALLDLLLSHGHSAIGPEIRRELLVGRGRGVAKEPEGPAFDGDDTMLINS